MFDIEINQISKSFSGVMALKDIDFKVAKGELFGLIGPDGAGKTTLIRILTTLLLADNGTAKVNGSDVVKQYKDIRRKVGYMPGRFSLYPDLSVEENLNFFATIFNTTIEQNYDLIEDIYVQLEPFKKRRAGKLSGGMKQKLALCCALIHRPEVLFLDEPTTGVDTVSRKEFWEMLQRLKSEGITILVSTPYMDEANLCERIALIQSGEILSIDTPKGITSAYPDPMYAIKSERMIPLLRDLRKMPEVKSVHAFGEYHHLSFNDHNPEIIQRANSYLTTLGHQQLSLTPVAPSIEDCFIHLMSTN